MSDIAKTAAVASAIHRQQGPKLIKAGRVRTERVALFCWALGIPIGGVPWGPDLPFPPLCPSKGRPIVDHTCRQSA